MPPHVTLSQPNRYIIVIIGAFAVSFIGALFLAAPDMGSTSLLRRPQVSRLPQPTIQKILRWVIPITS